MNYQQMAQQQQLQAQQQHHVGVVNPAQQGGVAPLNTSGFQQPVNSQGQAQAQGQVAQGQVTMPQYGNPQGQAQAQALGHVAIPVPLEIFVDMVVMGARVSAKVSTMEEAKALIKEYQDEADLPTQDPNAPPMAIVKTQVSMDTPSAAAATTPAINTKAMVQALAVKVANTFCAQSRQNLPNTVNLALWENNVVDWLQNQFAANPGVYLDLENSSEDKLTPKDNEIVNLVNINAQYLVELSNG